MPANRWVTTQKKTAFDRPQRVLRIDVCTFCPVRWGAIWLQLTLIPKDYGKKTLIEAYFDDSFDVEAAGSRLGQWLASFHGQTRLKDCVSHESATAFRARPYLNLADTLETHGFDRSIGVNITRNHGDLVEDDEFFCHGDFSHRNVTCNGAHLVVGDWGMCHRGHAATDVGLFAAEAYCLDNLPGRRGLLPAFLEGYRANGKLSVGFLLRFAVHMGMFPIMPYKIFKLRVYMSHFILALCEKVLICKVG